MTHTNSMKHKKSPACAPKNIIYGKGTLLSEPDESFRALVNPDGFCELR